ncbi:MAG: type II 3-dehydroquinate dehydratase [Oscillospiraceae bacterium]|nr:type II 3-dehydroquinate dehydratase [Oscillospiraceae bacterium]
MKRKIIILLGPNLNMTGIREKGIYGEETADKIKSQIIEYADSAGLSCEVFQTNFEGALIDKIQEVRDDISGGIINAGALSHYSYCLRDAISGTRIPFVEVHMSNIYARESFRSKSVIASVCVGQITGFGKNSYFLGVDALKAII